MIGLKRPPPEPPRYSDPEEELAGKCMTCSTVVGCLRRDAARPAKETELGAWGDMLSTECPQCGARVFVMPAGDLKKLIPPE